MAFLSARTSRGKKYWSVCQSKRINGKPRNVPLLYLGTAETLFERLSSKESVAIKSSSHGHVYTLLKLAEDLNLAQIIDRHVPAKKNGRVPVRHRLSVGSSFLLAAIGRACHPTSKMGWYDWCKTTSLEYIFNSNFSDLDSQHFWDQMDLLPKDAIPKIEKDIVAKVIEKINPELGILLYDTTNFFTFIDSQNKHCDLPKRGKNKQKRYDLRQIGMALAVTRRDQIPLFHKTYQGNKNDFTCFKEIFDDLFNRLSEVVKEMSDITLVFDKGNNSKENFKKMDDKANFYYVAGLVSSHFKQLIAQANKYFQTIEIENEDIPCYRLKKEVWGKERTVLVSVSKQLKEGQIQGIHQHLEKKYKALDELKCQLENPKKRKKLSENVLKTRLKNMIKGQFIEDILKYEFVELATDDLSFTYSLDNEAFDYLKENILGRKIYVTNRHDWSSEDIMLAYRSQSKVEYSFRNLKNPYHLAIRPQYHWTDQKIEVHIMICVIGYLLTTLAYSKARREVGYKRSISNFLNDLSDIRLACTVSKKDNKVSYQLEETDKKLSDLVGLFHISA
jgi:transposase